MATANTDVTPAIQVNHRNRMGVRAFDPNRMVNLNQDSFPNAASGNASQNSSQKNPAMNNNNSSNSINNNATSASLAGRRIVSNPPTVLTLAGVRRFLCDVTNGGAFSLDNIVVPDPSAAPEEAMMLTASSVAITATADNANTRVADIMVGRLIEGCEPGLRTALEMCWLRVGRNTRRFVTEVQSCTEASLLLRGRLHFGFEVALDTLVCYLAPTLAVRLEMQPTAVHGIVAPPPPPATPGTGTTPVMNSAGGASGKMLTSNGASPATTNPAPPPPPSASAPRTNTTTTTNDVDDDANNGSGNNNALNSSVTSGGSSGNRSALRRQRNEKQQQQQHEPLDKTAADGAALFSPLRFSASLTAASAGAGSSSSSGSNVVGSSAPIGLSRQVEDKIWLDTADLFCDALALMGDESRAVVMQVIVETLMTSCPVLCDTYRSFFGVKGVAAATATPSQKQQQNPPPSSDPLSSSSSPFVSFHGGNSGSRVSLQADTAAALNPRSSVARSSSSACGTLVADNSSSATASSNSSSGSPAAILFDPSSVSPNLELRPVFRAALSAADPRQAEAARQSLIEVLRSVSATNPEQQTSGQQQQQTRNPHIVLPRWAEGIPHNDGSSVIIRELVAAEQRTPYVDYFKDGSQPELTAHMRMVLVDWLHAICTRLRMSDATFHLTVSLLDRALTKERNVGTRLLQQFGIAAMLLASKYHEIAPPAVSQFVYMSANAWSADEILTSERVLFNLLDAYVTMPSTMEAADLILAEQQPPATNEQRAFVHFLLHSHLHFSIYGGEGRTLAAARAAVFLSRVEFQGLDLLSETMVAEQHEAQQAAAASSTGANNTTTATTATSTAAAAAAAAVRRPSSSSSHSTATNGSNNTSTSSSTSTSTATLLSNRACSQLPHWHVSSAFLSETEAEVCNELLTAVSTLRDPAKGATDLVTRYSNQKFYCVASRPAATPAVQQRYAAKIDAAVAAGKKFAALHTPATPDSSAGSSPASTTSRSVRGD